MTRTITSEKVNINSKQWLIFKPTISKNNSSLKYDKNIPLMSHFDKYRINSLFENLSSLNLLDLNKVMKDYESLGYSIGEVKSHIYKLYSLPLFLSIMTIFASIIMFNIGRLRSLIFHIVLGILLSVIIYYCYYLFNLLGENGKIPTSLSVFFPLFILIIIILMGLVRINEK